MNPTEYWNGVAGAYEIERSLRFNNDDLTYLTRTPSSAGDRETYTISMWVKRGKLSFSRLIGAYVANNYMEIVFNGDHKIVWYHYLSGYAYHKITTPVYRDPGAWMHLVFVFDSNNTTADDRMKIYVNGQRITTFDTSVNPSAGFDDQWNNTCPNVIGDLLYAGSPGNSFDGYMAEVYNIDGTALTASDFGETDTKTGAWIPKKYSGSYGTNGFYLPFSDNSSVSALGTDSSGNGNNWTPTNFSVSAGADNDSMEDTPTNNWSTLNPLDKSSQISLSQGNLSGTGGSFGGGDTFGQAASTIGLPTSGKFLFEIKRDAAGSDSNVFGIGISKCDRGGNRWPSTRQGEGYVGYYSFEYGFVITHDISSNNVTYRNNNTISNTYSSSSTSTSAVYGLAIDCDASTATFYENGTAISGALSFVHPGSDAVVAFLKSDFQFTVNFGQRGFSYPISGFKALNTANLPEPTIKNGAGHFQTVLYTGNSADRNIDVQDNLGNYWQPDFVWIKERNPDAAHHRLYDKLRTNSALFSSSTSAEFTSSTDGIEFNYANGFNIDNGANAEYYNQTNETYVAWNWLAGGSSSLNEAGTIDSTVSVNTAAGFSVGTFSGTGSTGSIGHGLGDAPKFILIKNRDSSTSWAVYHDSIGPNKQILLNSSNSASTDTNGFPSAPTSTVINVGSGAAMDTNQSGSHVFYAFAEVEGYSKIGSYTGNGSSTDGPFVYCGFKPAFIIAKVDASGYNWSMYDSVRSPYNASTYVLFPNLSNTEAQSTDHFDWLSNGFKIRGTSINANGTTVFFMAFAETPFKHANAR